MEVDIKYIPFEATVWDVKRAIGAILHTDAFFDASQPNPRPLNFKVELNTGEGISNDGTGRLVLHDSKIAKRFTRLANERSEYAVRVRGKKLRFRTTGRVPNVGLKATLEKTPYLDPNIEEEKETILHKLDVGLHVDKVQFGTFYREPSESPKASRYFSCEYEMSYATKSAGLLQFEYGHKLMRIQVGDRVTEEFAYNIVIRFANIRKMAVGLDFGNPFVCFELLTPPIFQLERFNRTLTGQNWTDNRKYRQRLDSLGEAHKVIAPYAHQMRIILHEQGDLEKLRYLCIVAGLTRPFVAKVEAFTKRFYSGRTLYNISQHLASFDWPVAFQIEALLHNGLMNTKEFLDFLLKPIQTLCHEDPHNAADVLRLFTDAVRTDNLHPGKPILDRLRQIREGNRVLQSRKLHAGHFLCHHVTVTPTRLVLEGPFVIQSNRVIREYEGYGENFLRVDFREEDRLQYRWERDTDGATLLHDRVGGILKRGLDLGGRHFEFLAYSSSALREHAVWFVNPFEHAKLGHMDAHRIRSLLGDFTNVIQQPSKYAARMAQAFTATDPSVCIRNDQWEEVDDIGREPYLHTDGVGTISPELADLIWEALCAARKENYKRFVKPSAYQIRFLGYKGMVSVDDQLTGVKMRLRKSMNKFKGPPQELPAVEIARAFERPNTFYLNRPLIMVLEDRGVDKRAFLKLQTEAIASIHMASDSMLQCRQLFREHSLGPSYRLAHLFNCLKEVHMGMEHERAEYTLQEPFINRLICYAKNSVLRSLKHGARIPVRDSWLLVGVADEGPAYEEAGYDNVFALTKGEICVCVQGPEDPEPIYVEGPVTISRSPVVHPGDVQRVTAVGKPPDGVLCLFRHLKNVVVLPCVDMYDPPGSGKPRSLPSMLGGGDLDGDLYAVIKESTLLPPIHHGPAEYEPVPPRTLDRDSTIEDICDFVVEYINSDVLGLLSDRHLIIADQSSKGTTDPECLTLAGLCSQAVDYPKNGTRVDIHDSPRWLIPFKPDWKKSEDNVQRNTDYYESSRALGELFRNVTLLDAPPRVQYNPNGAKTSPRPLSNSISIALFPYIIDHLGPDALNNPETAVSEMEPLFRNYVEELRYMCLTHALADDSRLDEEEVVIGSILATCSQNRYRSDRMHRMRLHSSVIVNEMRQKLYWRQENAPQGQVLYGLSQAWLAWDFATRQADMFGAYSFGLVALGAIMDALEDLGDISVRRDGAQAPAQDIDLW